MTRNAIDWPNGARFAFSILDDTDDATLENVRPIYLLLRDLGFRTTKTVWPVPCPEGSELFFAGETLADEPYRQFVRELKTWGFEIAFHCATMETSLRTRTEAALEVFRAEFGVAPAVHCNHGYNRENLYWGNRRYDSPLIRGALAVADRLTGRQEYEGHVPSSPYFWGDYCHSHVSYVRNFSFRAIDMSRVYPGMPYRRPSTPYVNAWFDTADAPDSTAFKRLMTLHNIDRLAESGGWCVVSTHLGKGFVRDGVVDKEVRDRLERIAKLGGCLVPVSELLGYLGVCERHDSCRVFWVELRHLIERFVEYSRWKFGRVTSITLSQGR